MVKKVIFVLPPDRSMVSSYVRGKCLEAFAPADWEFLFVLGADLREANRLRRIVNFFSHYLRELQGYRAQKSLCYIYFIKPQSAALVFITRFVYGFRTYIDINDPIHLKEHLGTFAAIKSRLMLCFAGGVIFESAEYKRLIGKNVYYKSCVIEDTPQFSEVYESPGVRQRRVTWFGSPKTSLVLLEFIEHLEVFQKNGYMLYLLGADNQVVRELERKGVLATNQPTYGHGDLKDALSDSEISFVPMPDRLEYTLRGNLKAKFGMACACVTIASNIEMHRRLIEHGATGFLFSSLQEFSRIVEGLASDKGRIDINRIARLANAAIVEKFNPSEHAKQITKFFDSRN